MPVENCPKCSGTGWIARTVDGLEMVKRCDCDLDIAVKASRYAARSGIPPLYEQASFENFNTPKDNPAAKDELLKVMSNARTFARNFPATEKPGILFFGGTGTGKTHLAVSTLNALIAQGFEGTFFDYQTLLDRIMASWDRTSGTTDREAYKRALETEVLLLDDLGARRVADWVEDTMAAIITHRCNHRMPTIVTTNLPPPGQTSNAMKDSLQDRIGARAWSRLNEMCRVIKMPLVEDYRMNPRR